MILLLARQNDIETERLAKELSIRKIDFIWIDDTLQIKDVVVDVNQACATIYGKQRGLDVVFELNDKIETVWWRAEVLRFCYDTFPDRDSQIFMEEYLKHDWHVILNYIEQVVLADAKFIGCPDSERNQNKLVDLSLAQKFGLNIPSTLIAGNYHSVNLHYTAEQEVIYKHHGKRINRQFKNTLVSSPRTKLLERSVNDQQHATFHPTLFQDRVTKAFEIKVLYIANQLYSTANFSANKASTSLDYRVSNLAKVRIVPFQLPDEIAQKIKRLIQVKSLAICTIDLICTATNEYVFLEVNPTGRYHWFIRQTDYPVLNQIIKVMTQTYAYA